MRRVEIERRYQPFVLKHYRYWTLLLNERQRYLGRAVAWHLRPGSMQRFSALSQRELVELRHITRQYEGVLNEMGWKPDHVNYAMLGNFFHEHDCHGHLHIIPRYRPRANPPAFMGITFEDDRWGKNYTPETTANIPARVLAELVRILKEKLR